MGERENEEERMRGQRGQRWWRQSRRREDVLSWSWGGRHGNAAVELTLTMNAGWRRSRERHVMKASVSAGSKRSTHACRSGALRVSGGGRGSSGVNYTSLTVPEWHEGQKEMRRQPEEIGKNKERETLGGIRAARDFKIKPWYGLM